MARPSVIPGIKERLEIYLDTCEASYLRQPEESRSATIPATPDGKVNVRAVSAAIGLKTTQEKYLYEREELYTLVNMMAEGQGLYPIGSRLTQDAADKATKEKAILQSKRLRAVSQAAVEAQSHFEELVKTIEELSRDNQHLAAENARLRARMEEIEAGIYMPEAE